ncbi:MAG: efflux RND transporter periplasmic adaptor subunit [bacterium]
MLKRPIVITMIAVLVLLIGLWGFFRWLDRDVIAIKTAVAKISSIESIVSATGTYKAPVYELGSKTGGILGAVLVKEGQYVKAGQLLAYFDSYDQAYNDFQRTYSLYKKGFATLQQYDAARTILDTARIVAPNPGIVAKVNMRKGETAVPGNPVIVIVNEGESWIEAQVDEVDIADVKIGQNATIVSDVYPDKKFGAQLTWIAPLAELRQVGGRIKMDEESFVFPIKLKLTSAHRELKANMSVNADIIVERRDNTVTIPREALFNKNEKNYVFVISEDRSYEKPIEPGIRSYSDIEVLSGLAAGDIVAITNTKELKDKGRVSSQK